MKNIFFKLHILIFVLALTSCSSILFPTTPKGPYVESGSYREWKSERHTDKNGVLVSHTESNRGKYVAHVDKNGVLLSYDGVVNDVPVSYKRGVTVHFPSVPPPLRPSGRISEAPIQPILPSSSESISEMPIEHKAASESYTDSETDSETYTDKNKGGVSWSLVIGIAICIILVYLLLSHKSKGITSNNEYSSDNSGTDYSNPTYVSTSSSKTKTNPLFEVKKIDKAILSNDKILRDSRGGKIGTLEKAVFSNDQIIRDISGKKAGRIEQSVWDSDKQIIKGVDGKKEGEIKTDFWGNRSIVNSEGKKVGIIEKNIWGETVVKKK